jgi:hypothetical protein
VWGFVQVSCILSLVLWSMQRRDDAEEAQQNLDVAIVLATVVCLTCFLSFWQEGESAKAMDAFKVTRLAMLLTTNRHGCVCPDGIIILIVVIVTPPSSSACCAAWQRMMAESTKVRRRGRELEVRVEELVKGDIVVLEFGMRVPADCRIIHTDSLKVCSAATAVALLAMLTTPFDRWTTRRLRASRSRRSWSSRRRTTRRSTRATWRSTAPWWSRAAGWGSWFVRATTP